MKKIVLLISSLMLASCTMEKGHIKVSQDFKDKVAESKDKAIETIGGKESFIGGKIHNAIEEINNMPDEKPKKCRYHSVLCEYEY